MLLLILVGEPFDASSFSGVRARELLFGVALLDPVVKMDNVMGRLAFGFHLAVHNQPKEAVKLWAVELLLAIGLVDCSK